MLLSYISLAATQLFWDICDLHDGSKPICSYQRTLLVQATPKLKFFVSSKMGAIDGFSKIGELLVNLDLGIGATGGLA
jgi:hypothetical protein